MREAAPDGHFLWNNQQVVRWYPRDEREPWASIYTKRTESLVLTLLGPKNGVALGRISELGTDRELDGSKPDGDVVKVAFRTREDLYRGDLAAFLKEHLALRLAETSAF